MIGAGGVVQEYAGIDEDVAAPTLVGLGGNGAAIQGDDIAAVDGDVAAFGVEAAVDGGADGAAVEQPETGDIRVMLPPLVVAEAALICPPFRTVSVGNAQVDRAPSPVEVRCGGTVNASKECSVLAVDEQIPRGDRYVPSFARAKGAGADLPTTEHREGIGDGQVDRAPSPVGRHLRRYWRYR